ncbi:glycosyltransferase [Cribrihabitans neustonicus]|uniref:glycosyltransferase n=1 Tax=Cribrihabitans neustonicus TaxID=1429085 RepID=UPI003B5C2A05
MTRFVFHQDKLVSSKAAAKVFEDPQRIRGRRVRALVIFAVTAILCWAILFLNGAFSLQSALREMNPFYGAARGHDHVAGGGHDLSHHAGYASPGPGQSSPQASGLCRAGPKQPYLSAMADTAAPRVFAHVPVGMERAHLSLEESCGHAGVVVPDWIRIGAEHGSPGVSLVSKDMRMAMEEYIASSEIKPVVLPIVQLDPAFKVGALLGKLADSEQAVSIAARLSLAVTALQAQGACLDFSGLTAEGATRLRQFAAYFSESFRAQGLTACVVLSGMQPSWRDPDVAKLFDQVILKVFQQPWTGSVPAPLAPENWFAEVAEGAVQAIGADKLIIALGNYAVEWTSGVPEPETLSYAAAMHRISAAGAGLRFSAKTSNSFSRYRDEQGRQRQIWMLDAASAHNQMLRLEQLGVANIAIWSLGREDPGVWKVLQNWNATQDVLGAELSVAELGNFVNYIGEGAFMRVAQQSSAGVRQLEFDPGTGRISSQTYSILPKPYTIERYGKAGSRKLVLTFDDGPHPKYTKQILDILHEEKVPAAFFVVGTSVMNAPELIARMIDEGHEIGAHTFSHPRMDQISKTRAELEFSLLDKILAGTAGRKTLLYREPFLRSGGPISAEGVASLEAAQARGSIIAGMDIVPRDWEGWDSERIASHVIGQVEQGAGNVILLHDGGQDRTATVAAVRSIIGALKAKGYEFTALADLLGTDRASLMPVAAGGAPAFDRVSFSMVWFAQQAVIFVFWTVLVIGVLRSAAVLVLALSNRREKYVPLRRLPKVAVVIPAYNEAKVIARSIESVRASGYKNLEIIVVDDGSTDDTLIEVLKFGRQSGIRLISQPNQGKWSALNRAILSAGTEFVVCIDADTQVCKSSIAELMRHFADPKVGAVAGKIIAGNRVNLLTRLQALEYATSQNVDRKAFDKINGILVVPGAIGAWRVEALERAGLFTDETLTEDTDLTIQVNRAGYRVIYEPRARGYTEVPETTGELLRQRLRWSLGMFQSAWKHKRAVSEGRSVGLISIPDMFVFGYIFPLLAPVADLFVILLLYKLAAGGWAGDVGASQSAQPAQYLLAYLALPALEFLVAAVAVASDDDESNWTLLLFPLQRLIYRPLLYFSVIRAILRAVNGRLASWGTLKRQGRDYGLAAAKT